MESFSREECNLIDIWKGPVGLPYLDSTEGNYEIMETSDFVIFCLLFQNAEDGGLDQNGTNGFSYRWSDPGYVCR